MTDDTEGPAAPRSMHQIDMTGARPFASLTEQQLYLMVNETQRELNLRSIDDPEPKTKSVLASITVTTDQVMAFGYTMARMALELTEGDPSAEDHEAMGVIEAAAILPAVVYALAEAGFTPEESLTALTTTIAESRRANKLPMIVDGLTAALGPERAAALKSRMGALANRGRAHPANDCPCGECQTARATFEAKGATKQ